MNVGEAVKLRIIELCEENKITVNKLAAISGINQSTLNNIVGGRNNSAAVSAIKKFVTALKSPSENSSPPQNSTPRSRR